MSVPPGLTPGKDYELATVLSNNAVCGNEIIDKLQDLVTALNEYMECSVVDFFGRKYMLLGHPAGSMEVVFPFYVAVGQNESGSFYCTVNDGVVVERLATADADDDGILYHKCGNTRDTNGDLVEHGVSAGKGVYVYLRQSENGNIDSEPTIVIDADDKKSNATTGEYYYRLATFEADGNSLKVIHVASGSHIYHETGLTADYRVIQCENATEEGSDPEQLHRLRFLSGRLAGIDESVEEVPLSSNIVEMKLVSCDHTCLPDY